MSLCLLGVCPNKDKSIFSQVIKTQVVFSFKSEVRLFQAVFFCVKVEQLDIDYVSCNINQKITHFFFFLLIVW